MSFAESLREKIRKHGPISFYDYMDAVLRYYYSLERNPIGVEGDFFTSADLDAIFGETLAAHFEEMASGFDSFTLLELGAGKGLLARDILSRRALPYKILERSPRMRERQQALLKDFAVEWIDTLPSRFKGCIFSNEFFDALPVHRVVRRGGELREVYVDADFRETEGPLQVPIDAPVAEGCTADINIDAREWIRRIAGCLERGYHLAIDYGYLSKEFYAQPRGTLMCYWRHQAVEDPYVRIGEQDMTAHVNFSDLIDEGAAAGLETQSLQTQKDYLVSRGILDEMQRLAVAGDAASMQRLLKIKRLILPGSMGERFKVLIQVRRPGGG
jgi:SAM-dependent MidA family methyltransferase